MTRTAARQLALQLSFALSAGSDLGPEDFFDEEYFNALPDEDALFSRQPDPAQREYICALVNGVRERREELDEIITRLSRRWKITRISRTALEVLRCALYEILYMPNIPEAASINEAVELAKKYDDPETVSFINGILGAFMRSREDAGPEAGSDETV
jgi:N utilization substance protein B